MEQDVTVGRRAEVLRRLLDRGLSPPTLQALLPGWEPLLTEMLNPYPQQQPAARGRREPGGERVPGDG